MIVGLILVVVIVVIGFFFWSEISAFVNDTTTALNQQARDNNVSVPKPVTGQTVCDLLIDIDVRSSSATTLTFSTERILFTNGQEGKQIGWQWDNCHQYTSGLLSLSILDYFGESEYPTLEFFIGSADSFDQKIIMSYILEDENRLEKKLPLYQNVKYIHPAYQGDFDFNQKLKYYDLPIGDYTLKMIPLEAHFNDKKVGEALEKSITRPT